MGAGAGCTLVITDSRVISVSDVSLQNAVLETRSWDAALVFDCVVGIEGTVNMSSYYDGSGDVKEVSMTVNALSMWLGFSNGYNEDILTADAVNRFENQFGGSINDITEEFLPVLTVEDINPDYIRSTIQQEAEFNGECHIGGGWTGFTFDGAFEMDDVNGSSYNPIISYSAQIDEEFVIYYLDKAKYGDNVEYTAYYNGDVLETYETQEDAIEALVQEISENIGDTDIYDCWVEQAYYYLANGSVDRYEFETDWSTAEVVYKAEDEFSDELFDAMDELNAENEPGIGEDFDI